MTDSPALPAPENATGFKEWALVCDLLVQGKQTVILRKGGIHEGRGGFEWKHRGFFLFPTWFHTQAEKLRGESPQTSFPPEEERTSVDVDGFATLEQVWKVTDWARVESISRFHAWNEEVVRERFAYDEESCLHIALVRAWRLPGRWTFPYSKSYGGCRSWVSLPAEGLDLLPQASPAMSEAEWQQTAGELRALLD
ncbi:MAG TPA: DUF1802 family protein [Prosthecobacter sp.]|nr:DUF1802 family protein [Prosthecobacter sp.]HRK13869.1 DUF1802 family protein [Prosthecobacter sp.]